MTMTWKRSERVCVVGLGVCVFCCGIVLPQAAQRGAAERQKSTLYIGKYRNLRPLNAVNTQGNYQKGFHAFACQWAFRVAHFHSGRFFFENPMMPLGAAFLRIFIDGTLT